MADPAAIRRGKARAAGLTSAHQSAAGKARAASMTAEERKAIAAAGGKATAGRKRKAKGPRKLTAEQRAEIGRNLAAARKAARAALPTSD